MRLQEGRLPLAVQDFGQEIVAVRGGGKRMSGAYFRRGFAHM